jgi:adenine phosphoribosyltransferase
MIDLKPYIAAVPDFPRPGILFRDIMPLLRAQFAATIAAMDDLLTAPEWEAVDAIAGIESRGFILGAALAQRRGKGFIPIRKQGKLPPPVASLAYQLEYAQATLEMQRGGGRIVIVDDVLATGGTLAAAAELCQQTGYETRALLLLIDLGMIPGFHCKGMAPRTALRY